MSIKKTAKLSNTELSAFCAQLSMILRSGISAYEGISVMDSEAETEAEHILLGAVLENLNEGDGLYASLEKTQMFPAYMLSMIRIGEESGTLDTVMQSLSEHYEREENISAAVRNTVRYPAVMAAMMLSVIVILLVKVMPVFNSVYIQLGGEMTGISRILMNAGRAISRSSAVLAGIAFVLLALAVFAFFTEKGRALSRRAALKSGMFKKLRSLRETVRFADGMALALSAGLDPESAMVLVSSLGESEEFAKKLERCRESYTESGDFSEALRGCGIFSGVYAHMAAVGIKTGSTAEVMHSIAVLCSDELETKMNNLLAAIEPALVITLSLTVGLILMSVMLPLVGIISGI